MDGLATAPMPEPVRASLEANRFAAVAMAQTLVGHDTQNSPGETPDLVSYLEDSLTGAGIETDRVAVDPETPTLVARVADASDRTLWFDGHLDTVPVEAADWSRDPLGERARDRLYGRGA